MVTIELIHNTVFEDISTKKRTLPKNINEEDSAAILAIFNDILKETSEDSANVSFDHSEHLVQ